MKKTDFLLELRTYELYCMSYTGETVKTFCLFVLVWSETDLTHVCSDSFHPSHWVEVTGMCMYE